jgi:hypothetical protein
MLPDQQQQNKPPTQTSGQVKPPKPTQPPPKPVDIRNPPDVKASQYFNQYYEPYYNSQPPELKAAMKSPDKIKEIQLGYVPSGMQDPKRVVEAWQIMKATPKDMALPAWMQGQEQAIEQAYRWHELRNKNKPPAEWAYLPGDDPGLSFLGGIKGPPTAEEQQKEISLTGLPDQVKKGEAAWNDIDPSERRNLLRNPDFDITEYPIAMRDQILNDPSFDWSRVPKWQKTYYSIMSNPKIMASPMALAGANAGGLFGLPGKLVGAAAGYGLGLVGGQQYDPTASVLDQPTLVAGAMAVLNKLSEGAEQSAGYTGQVLDAAIAGMQGNEKAADAAQKMITDPAYRKATWEAGRFAYESSDFMGARNWIPGIARLLGDETAVLAGGGEDFIIGVAGPVDRAKAKGFNPVTGNFYDVTDSMGILQEARLTIHKAILAGEDPKEVIRQIMGEQGQYVGSTVADFAGQMAIDPLEHLPLVANRTTGKLATLLGNETAARALQETSAPFEAARRYQTLVQTGDVAQGFDYSKMSSFSRFVAGLNDQGQIKAGPLTQTGLLDRPTKAAGIWSKFKEDIAALTPEARAREGATMWFNNIGAVLTTMSDPHEIAKFFTTTAKADPKLWAEMGTRIASAPEWYTILPALKDFDQNKIAGLLSAWDLAAPKREGLIRIADILGEQPATFIEDLAKRGTTEQDFQRVVSRLQSADTPEARTLLDEIQNGRFTPDHLKDIVEAFSGDGALYWHPDQWKAALMDSLGSHFDEWAVDRLELGQDSGAAKAFFRTTHLLKSAQSVLLLGGSPGYALQNGLSNMVHRAATGIYGYMTSRQIDTWLDRFGVTPARMEEGVGIGGVVEQASTKTSVQTTAIDQALRGSQNDALGKAQRIVSALGRAMPFNKLSSAFERLEGRNGYMIAMKDMWSQTWRRGKGFAEVTPELKQNLERAGINPGQLYNLIEAGMSKDEVERFIFSRQQGIMSRTLVNDAAQKMGIPATSAARLLEKVGVLDELDNLLKNANTPGKVRQAFTRAVAKAQDYQDMQTSNDLKAMAEQVTNKVETEGAPAALDVVQRVNGEYFDAWMDHYSRFGEMFDDLRNIPDEAVRNRAIDLNYKISDQEFRRVTARLAANYQGIFAAWKQTRNPKAMEIMAAIAQSDLSMREAYTLMRETRRTFFDQLRDNPNSIEPGRWEADQQTIDQAFDRAFKSKADAEKRMGESLAGIYEGMYGKAAGEAARKWWSDYTKFSDDIVKREKDFRKSLIGLSKEQREAAKQRFYGTDKVAQIAELERINQEGIARLERVIKRGGGKGKAGTPTTPRPDAPRDSGPGSDEINQLTADAEARQKEADQARREQEAKVWEIAGEYDYKPDNTADLFAIRAALRTPEYGGFPTLKGFTDERLTPDKIREILGNKQAEKTAQEAERIEQRNALAAARAELAREKAEKGQKDLTILQAIRAHGGIDIATKDIRNDITGNKTAKGWQVGIFSKKGAKRWSIDDLARILATEDNYPIDLNRPDDPGGVKQLIDLMQRAQRGEKVYPTTHDYTKEIDAAEKAYIETIQAEEAAALPDVDTWRNDFEQATTAGDLTRVYELFETLPEEGRAPTGESWTDYASRIADETAARVENEAIETAVDNMQAQIDRQTARMETRGNAAMTRQLLEEKFKDVFDLTDEQAAAYMEISESLAGWYERATGESGDAFYSRYYEDVVKGGEGELQQIAPVNRRMTPAETENYARALVRAGPDELRRAVAGEQEKSARIAILNAAYQINPQLAEQVAKQSISVLFQSAFHGTPHKFDQFTLDKIGTGEGAQVYGWGLYFAGDRSVAEWYRQKLTDIKPQRLEIDGEDVLGGWGETERQSAANRLENAQGRLAYALEELGVPRDEVNDMVRRLDYAEIEKYAGRRRDLPGTIEDVRELNQEYLDIIRQQRGYLEFYAKTQEWNASKMDSDGIIRRVQTDLQNLREGLQRQQERGDGDTYDQQYRKSRIESIDAALEFMDRHDTKVLPKNEGKLYEVDIPDEGYLFWDKPLKEQSPEIQALAREFYDLDPAWSGAPPKMWDNFLESKTGEFLYHELERTTGRWAFKEYGIGAGPEAASKYLSSKGINGIKYLDGSSRSAGEGNFNYVIFDDAAIQIKETFYQATKGPTAKGAVAFDPEGIKATIHAFEAKDVSTLIHENAHVFRRVLADVATRTDSKRIRADLSTIEEWAGVKDGQWNRDAEEKFARGFERYITDGNAPTPKLKKAFESFKQWMIQVYRTISGSEIDVTITPEVREVFDRMLGEDRPADVLYQRKKAQADGQLSMFGAGEDMPLFSGTAQTAKAETFTPQPAARQETMFDMRPQMKGAEVRPSVWDTLTDEQINPAERILEGMRANARKNRSIEEIAAAADKKFSRKLTPEIIQALAEEAYNGVRNDAGEIVTTINPALGGLINSVGPGGEIQPQNLRDQVGDLSLSQFTRTTPADPNVLFQNANPLGTMEDASGFKADSEWQDAGWKQHVRPLLDAMQETALEKMQTERPLDGAYKDMSPEGQAMLRTYIRQVQNDMGAVKNSTIKWGEKQRDFAMLNYNRRYGFDRMLETVAPYQFYYTRSLMTWGMRALDKPAWFANYARIRNAQNQHERDTPERLRNKFRIPAPWLPDWMGDAMYIDPVGYLFAPANFLRPVERMMQDKNYQVIEAERVLQEWAADGQASEELIVQAAQSQSGALWERALAEAGTRREAEISNPFDFMATMFGPAWYLSTPLNLAGIEVPFLSKGEPGKVSTTPLLNTARALEATTAGTWAEPIGQFASLIGKPEELLRKKAGLPEFGEFGDYYVDRQLANMVAEGMITSDQAQTAMIERQGDLFDQARQRVKMELSLRTPFAGTVYAATHEGAGAAAKSFLPSLFGSGLLPAGELEFRGLKQEWNAAWKSYDQGDKTAINTFFEEHPEYEAYLAKGKEPEERLRSYLIGNIWDAYMELGATNQKAARAQMGEDFARSFLDKETRSYDTLDVQTLTQWAQTLGAMGLPRTPETTPVLDLPAGQQKQLSLYDEQTLAVTDRFFNERKEKYPDYFMLEQGYYSVSPSERAAYMLKFPKYAEFKKWRDGYYKNYPELKPILQGKVFKQVDTSTWAPGLEDHVAAYAMTGRGLGKGATSALEQIWIREGKPMDDFKTWLNSQVVPAFLYGQGQ